MKRQFFKKMFPEVANSSKIQLVKPERLSTFQFEICYNLQPQEAFLDEPPFILVNL